MVEVRDVQREKAPEKKGGWGWVGVGKVYSLTPENM
jgi:hypothetical protein